MLCAICSKPVQKTLHGYGVCPFHATSLGSAILHDFMSADEWYRMHRKEHLRRQGMP